MSPDSADAPPGSPDAVPPDAPLFAEIAPLRLAVGVVFSTVVAGAVATGVVAPSVPELAALVALCLVFLAGGFVPFDDTLGYHVAQAAGFLLWGLARVLVVGPELLPVLLGAFGAVGLAVYGRRALSEGLRTYA